MRRPQRDDDVVQVELVEHDEPLRDSVRSAATGTPGAAGVADEDDPASDAPAAGPRRRRALWWVGAAVLVLLAGAGVVANVAAARQAAERREAVAGLSWVLPDMSGGLEEVWRVRATWVEGDTDQAIFVAGSTDYAGGFAALDPQTGELLWEPPVGDTGYCYLSWDWGTFGLALAGTDATPDVVLCDLYDRPLEGGPAGPSTVAVDAATGERLAELVGNASGVLGTFTMDGDYVLVRTVADDALNVVRQDLRTGETVWEYLSEPGRASDLVGRGWGLNLLDGHLVIDGTAPVVLEFETGTEVEDVPDTVTSEYEFALADGSGLRLRFEPDGQEVTGAVLGADGAERFEFTGYPWFSSYGDSSKAGVIVVQEYGGDVPGEVVALDLVTGEELWRNPQLANSGGPFLMVRDVAVIAEDNGARAVDLPTGRELWLRALPAASGSPGFATDGDVVVTWEGDVDGARFVAFDLETGEDRWTIPAPTRVTMLRPTRTGLLLAVTSSEVVAYRAVG